MSEKIGNLGYIIVDCKDNELVASFWSKTLGLEISTHSYPYIDLSRDKDNTPVISFQKVEESKIVKNRVHLDVKVSNLEIATAQIEAIGGTLLKICFEDPYSWRVMADPEANEFCIVLQ